MKSRDRIWNLLHVLLGMQGVSNLYWLCDLRHSLRFLFSKDAIRVMNRKSRLHGPIADFVLSSPYRKGVIRGEWA